MKDKDYLVKRNDIFAGKVISANYIYETCDHSKVYPMFFDKLRSTLFILDGSNLADDLLYDAEKYPVLNITENSKVLEHVNKSNKSRLVIADAVNISKLLEHYGYNEELTHDDIVKIRKEIFSYIFLNQHVFDFGYVMKNNYYPVLKESPLFDYFDTVNQLRDGVEENKDAFKPSKAEGPVRKLK